MRIPCAASTDRLTRLRFGLLNVRSLGKRDIGLPAVFCDNIGSDGRDVFAAVETWHEDSRSYSPCPSGYCVLEIVRPRFACRGEDTNDKGIAVCSTGQPW